MHEGLNSLRSFICLHTYEFVCHEGEVPLSLSLSQAFDTSSLMEWLHLRQCVKQQSECEEFRASEPQNPMSHCFIHDFHKVKSLNP